MWNPTEFRGNPSKCGEPCIVDWGVGGVRCSLNDTLLVTKSYCYVPLDLDINLGYFDYILSRDYQDSIENRRINIVRVNLPRKSNMAQVSRIILYSFRKERPFMCQPGTKDSFSLELETLSTSTASE